MTNERYLKIVTDLTVEFPVTSERKWASFQVTRHTQLVGWVDRRLFHSDSATVSQCDNFCCYMYMLCLKLYMTSQRWRVFCVFFLVFVFVGGGEGGGGGLISSVFSLVFGFVYWSRPPRVLRRFTALLFKLFASPICFSLWSKYSKSDAVSVRSPALTASPLFSLHSRSNHAGPRRTLRVYTVDCLGQVIS